MHREMSAVRRTQCGLLVGMWLLGGGLAAGADAQLKGRAVIEGQLTHASMVSEDGLAATVIFDNLLVTTDTYTGDQPVKTRTATISLPLKDAAQDVCITYQLRGYVATEKHTRAALVVHVGGATHVVDLAKAAATAAGPVTERVGQTRKQALAKSGEATRPKPVDDDFFFQFATLVPAGDTHKVTLFLLVERDGAEPERAYLQVDSLDCEIVPHKK